jgi:amidase
MLNMCHERTLRNMTTIARRKTMLLGKAQWTIGNINGQRTRIETSIVLHDTAFHGLCGWSWPTVGAVTCGGPPSVVERVREFAGEGGPFGLPVARTGISCPLGRADSL